METLYHTEQNFLDGLSALKKGQDDLKDDPREKRPSTSTFKDVKAVQDLVEKDRRITIGEILITLEYHMDQLFQF